MTAKIGGPATRTLNFQLVPKVIKIEEGRLEARLGAIPSSPFFLPKAELLASLKNGKRKIHLNGALRKLLKKISWDKGKLKPLSKHLKAILDQAVKKPVTILDILGAFLKKGCPPDFKVKVVPRLREVAPESINLNFLSTPEEVLNVTITSILPQEQAISFAIIPKQVKAKKGKIEVTLTALLSTSAGIDRKAKILATIKHGKSSFSYSQRLQMLLAQNSWTFDDLKPVQNFLNSALKTGRKDPEFIIGILSTYLKSSTPQSFIVRKSVV